MVTVALTCVCLILQVGNLEGLDRVDGSYATCVGGPGAFSSLRKLHGKEAEMR
jgi:hypothetical protein